MVVLKRADWIVERNCLSSESVQGASLPFEGVDNVHGGDVFLLACSEDLEDSRGLLLDESRDPLHSSPPRQTTDGGLSDALDVVPQHLTVTLGASLSQSLSSLSASSHCC